MKKWYIKCPFCANEVKEWIEICPFCEENLRLKSNITRNHNKHNKFIKILLIVIWIWILAFIPFVYIFFYAWTKPKTHCPAWYIFNWETWKCENTSKNVKNIDIYSRKWCLQAWWTWYDENEICILPENDSFEKKKLCTEMLVSYEDYLKKTWNVVEDDWYFQSVNDVDLFYSSSYDSCIWTFYLRSNMYSSSVNDITMNYMIYDYTNWNEELFSCFTKNDSWCFSKRKNSISELKDK